ncbi:PP2C family protein-serine/threonine phosphatase [Streptomyces sp. NPDC001744]|uniref:PP2C family protein-serine/threonine phosphatase n=1 Tax=Streptomyces sp. NPDC001744 TaxID=3364606 RepID=UPI00369C396F
MNAPQINLTIRTPADALRARQDVLALASAVPAEARVRLVTDLFGKIGTALDEGTTARLRVEVRPDPATGVPAVHAVLHTPGDGDGGNDGHTEPPPPRHAHAPAASRDGGEEPCSRLVRALADGDGDVRALVELLDWHRGELESTNQGVLALHAELDAAHRAQTELLTAEQAAREQAETARKRLSFLSAASATLSRTLDHERVLRDLTGMLVPEYAATAHIRLLDNRQKLTAPAGDTPDAAELPADHPAVLTARTGRVHHRAGTDRPGAASGPVTGPPLLSLPLTTGRTTLGVLVLTPPADRFTPDDVVMLTELARRAATALDNAQRYEHERDTAEILQRAMLTDLPAVPGLRMAARYLPAGKGMNVGGDWYDAFLHPDGTLTTVIGDVTGHGLDAAVLMSQLRHALRAYALQGHSPGALLTLLHDLMRSLQPGLSATALVAQLRPASPEVVWATAGHLPPLLRTPDGTVHVLHDRGGFLLGLPVDQTVRDHHLTLAPGSSLLLYTDGLVERRARGVDPGIRRLAAALAGLAPQAGGTVEQDAEKLLADLLRDSPGDDDTCLLLCHADPPCPSVPVRRPAESRSR